MKKIHEIVKGFMPQLPEVLVEKGIKVGQSVVVCFKKENKEYCPVIISEKEQADKMIAYDPIEQKGIETFYSGLRVHSGVYVETLYEKRPALRFECIFKNREWLKGSIALQGLKKYSKLKGYHFEEGSFCFEFKENWGPMWTCRALDKKKNLKVISVLFESGFIFETDSRKVKKQDLNDNDVFSGKVLKFKCQKSRWDVDYKDIIFIPKK